MNIMRYAFAAVIVCCLYLPPANAEDNGASHEYTVKNHVNDAEFKITLPDKWDFRECSGTIKAIAVLPGSPGFICISSEPITYDSTIQNTKHFFEHCKKMAEKYLPEFNLLSQEYFSLDLKDEFLWGYSYEHSGCKWQLLSCILVRARHAYNIIFAAPASDFPKALPFFKKTLETIKIEEKKEPSSLTRYSYDGFSICLPSDNQLKKVDRFNERITITKPLQYSLPFYAFRLGENWQQDSIRQQPIDILPVITENVFYNSKLLEHDATASGQTITNRYVFGVISNITKEKKRVLFYSYTEDEYEIFASGESDEEHWLNLTCDIDSYKVKLFADKNKNCESKRYYVSIAPPKTNQTIIPEDLILLGQDTAQFYTHYSISVTPEYLPRKTSLDKYCRGKINACKKIKDFELLEKNKAEIGGLKAIRLVYSFSDKNQKQTSMAYLLRKDSIAYIINFIISPDYPDKMANEMRFCDKIARTFLISKPELKKVVSGDGSFSLILPKNTYVLDGDKIRGIVALTDNPVSYLTCKHESKIKDKRKNIFKTRESAKADKNENIQVTESTSTIYIGRTRARRIIYKTCESYNDEIIKYKKYSMAITYKFTKNGVPYEISIDITDSTRYPYELDMKIDFFDQIARSFRLEK